MRLILAFKHTPDDGIAWYWRWAAKITKWGTKSDFFHVEIAIDDKWIGAHTEKGIEIHPFQELYDKTFDYYELIVEDLTESQHIKFWEFVKAQEKTGYDWKGIYLTQVIKIDLESKKKWFCSEIVSKILQMLYVKPFIDMKPSRASPQTVFNLIMKLGGRKIDMD